MAKGDLAKQHIIDTLIDFYQDSAAVIDKKVYINIETEEGVSQIAVSLTAPKNTVSICGVAKGYGKNNESPQEIEQNAQQMLDILGM